MLSAIRSTSTFENFELRLEWQVEKGGNSGVLFDVTDDGRVEHWMNGIHLLTYRLGDADWQDRVEASKFAPLPRYGRGTRGHIAIQDHDDPVRFPEHPDPDPAAEARAAA